MNPLIRKLAKELLHKSAIKAPPVPIDKIAKKEGVEVRYAAFEEDVSGLIYHEKNDVVIGVNAYHPKARQRFTIAHELGHYLLEHESDLLVDTNVLFRDSDSKLGVFAIERDANEFAAEILMPQEMIKKELLKNPIDIEDSDALAELANKFGVSTQALTYRLVNLELFKMY